MTSRRRKRQRRNQIKEFTNIIMAVAMVVIAVLMVTAVILYVRSGSFLGGLFGGSDESTMEALATESDMVATPDEAESAPTPGLNTLSTGEIVYVLTADDAEDYDEANLIALSDSGAAVGNEPTGGRDVTDISTGLNAEEYYYLADSWLEIDHDLYHFDEEGHACTDEYDERAFYYRFDEDGRLESISYNRNFREPSTDINADYPGAVQTRALRVYMDRDKTLGDYVALKYKRATESLTYYLGGDSNTQYASPYAYDICDSRIYYLALADRQASTSQGAVDAQTSGSTQTGEGSQAAFSQGSSLYESVAGKVFCMSPGADTRYIAAEGALGFKVLLDEYGDPVVYYYDGDRIRRSTLLTEDEDMAIFSEDADYVVNTDTVGKAYLELSTGQRVNVESDAFRAGNFTYRLSSDGEILSVADKSTVSLGGYTYEFQNGDSFGVDMTRLTRTDSEDLKELISGEAPGTVGDIHYDYGSGSIIAEYEDNNGGGGLLKASLDGDIDLITESRVTSGSVELYGISGGYAIYKVTGASDGGSGSASDGSASVSGEYGDNGDGDAEDSRDTLDSDVEFRRADISISSPIAAAVDPVPISPGEDESEGIVGEEPGAPSTEDYDDTNQGQAPPAESTGSPSGPSGGSSDDSSDASAWTGSGGIVVPGGPGSVDLTRPGIGPGGLS